MHAATGPIVGEDFDVFISYAHADAEADSDRSPAQALAAMLEAEGYTVWWDRQLIGGQDWLRELPTKIGFARKVIALVSPRWVASKDCYAEMVRAYETPDKLVPVFIADCELPAPIAHLNAIRAVGNLALAKALILAALEGLKPSNVPTPRAPSRLTADDIWLEGLPTGTPQLFGRDVELTTLLDAWASGGADAAKKTNAVVLHAIGGAGKSALLRRFLDALEEKAFPGAAKVYGWSAYSQGSGDNRNADADGFISRALKFFGHDLAKEPITDPVERGRTLARLVRKQRTLLVLDGLEPLQDLPHVNEGRLKDRGLQALVTQLARDNPGLLVITSRQELPELAQAKRPAVINHELNSLNERAGAELLKHLGVHGRETELMAAVKEVGGHALSVSLLGTYLSAVCAGDVARRDTLGFYELVDSEGETDHNRQAKRAARIMDAYVERFEALSASQAAGEGDPERLILSLVGLFDRPAEADAIAAVLAAPPIPDLTESWHALSPQQQSLRWIFALKRLRALKLIAAASDDAARATASDGDWSAFQAGTLDAHPVVRQHFGRRLKEDAPDAFREANRRLYEHYKALPEKLYGKRLPDTLEEMQSLFAAITHGCAAGLHQEVFDEVYYRRVLRGSDAYINNKLGASAADLGALAHFFDPPWGRPHPSMTAPAQAVALNFAGYALRALGRLREAVEPMRANVRMRVVQEAWTNAAIGVSGLSELLLTLGDVGPAVAAAREGVTYADQGDDAFWCMASRCKIADALHQAGKTTEAQARFAEAERLQKEDEPEHPQLYSLRGYQFCDLLLGQGRYVEVAERYLYLVSARIPGDPLLDLALEELAAGRAAHQAWRASPSSRERGEGDARRYLDAAVEGLRKAGGEHNIPNGLLARAAFRRDSGEWDKAQEDLGETYEIASRGGMRLHLADYHLERVRLLLAQLPQPTVERGWFRRTKTIPPALTSQRRAMVREAEQAWAEANALVQATGYRRRDGELKALRETLDALAA